MADEGAGVAGGGGRRRVLLVDDNAQNLELLEAFLAEMDVEVSFASDGVAALEKASAERPDLIILDIMMPRVSGYQACERLRADPALRTIPVLVVTALGEVNDVERAMDAGADDFLTKPVNRAELLVRVKALLDRGGAAQRSGHG